jgi:lysophospholipase L1-like esterase
MTRTSGALLAILLSVTTTQSAQLSDLFDGVIDFDAATRDPRTGGLRPEFQPNSSIGGPGDGLHPNRAGYLAMAHAVDLDMISSRRAK